jgi:hypothetical protein
VVKLAAQQQQEVAPLQRLLLLVVPHKRQEKSIEETAQAHLFGIEYFLILSLYPNFYVYCLSEFIDGLV